MPKLTFDKITQEREFDLDGVASSPGHSTIHLEIDSLISDLEIRYRRKKMYTGSEGYFYWGHHECGLVHFFSHSLERSLSAAMGRSTAAQPERVVHLVSGKQQTITGAWPSRAGVMNELFPDTVEVRIRDDQGSHKSAVRVSVLNKLLPLGYHLGWKREQRQGFTEKQYYLHTFGGSLDGDQILA